MTRVKPDIAERLEIVGPPVLTDSAVAALARLLIDADKREQEKSKPPKNGDGEDE